MTLRKIAGYLILLAVLSIPIVGCALQLGIVVALIVLVAAVVLMGAVWLGVVLIDG